MTIAGNYTQTAGYVYGSGYATAAAAATRAINIGGNFTINGGTFNLSSSTDAASATTLNIGKNFTQGSGTTITETGSSTGSAIRFVSSATAHVYTTAGTTSNTVNFIVDSGATLQMGTAAAPSTITGGGSFTLQSGGTLNVTSPAGISANGTNTGNIQCTGTRSYSAGNIVYMGNQAQATGNGLTAAANVSIINTAGVTFTVQAAVAGNISMAAGTTANLGTGFTHTASSLTLAPTAEPINYTYGGDSSSATQKRPTFFPNTATGIIKLGDCIAGSWTGSVSTDWHNAGNWCSNKVPTASDNVTIIAATNQPLISAEAVCNNITINAGATVTISGINTLTVSGTFTNNGSFVTNGGTLTVAGNYTNGGSFYGNTGTLVINSNTTAAFTNNGTFSAGTGTVNFNGGAQTVVTPAQTQFYNVIVGGTGLKTINATNFVVMGTLSMEQTGTLSALPVYGVPATLQYNRTAAYTTGVEWPATFSSTGGVVVKNSGTISLAANKTLTNCPLTVYYGATLDMNGKTIASPNALNLYCGGLSAGATISGTGTLTLGGNINVFDATNGDKGATISCSVALTTATSRTFNVADDGTTATDLTVSGIISTSGAIVKEGAGTLALSGANTYSGGTTLNAGTLAINSSTALGTVAGVFTINGGSIANTSTGAVTVANNNPIDLNADFSFTGTQNLNLGTGLITMDADRTITTTANTLTLGGTLSAAGFSLTKAGTGTLSFGSQAVTLKDLTISGGTLVSTSGNLGIAGSLTNSGTFTHNNGTVTFNGTAPQTINIGSSPFYNLTVSNTNTAGITAGSNITSAGTFTTNAGVTVDMGEYDLDVKTVAHSGTLNTQSTSLTPLTSGRTWGGLVNYNGTAAQTAMAGTYNNLTISTSTGGAKASGDITVNSVLDLSGSNASDTQGALEMVTSYGNYPRTNAENVYVPLTSHILTMGANATTTGSGDVTGEIHRSSPAVNTAYTFGNQYTTYAFTGPTAPTEVTVIVTIGTPYGSTVTPTWGDPASVKRSYEMVPTGGSGMVTMNLHYLDSELSGITDEENLVTGDFDIGSTGNPMGDEHGRSSFNKDQNYIGLSGVPISYFQSTWKTIFILRSYSPGPTVWDGSASTSWLNGDNWSNGVPDAQKIAVIPNANDTPNDPILVESQTIGGMRILSGGVLNLNTKAITLAGYNYNGWEDLSGLSNYAGSTVVFANSTQTGGPWPMPISGIPHFANLTINAGAVVTVNQNSHIFISGTFSNTGTFNAGSFENTVEYNGAAQTVIPPLDNTYYSLTLSGSGAKTLPTADLIVKGNLETAGAATVAPTNALTIGGNFTLGSGTIFTAGSLTHNLAGNFTNNGGTFTNTGSTINLNGTTAQTIGGTTSTTFNNLTLNNAAGATLTNSETVAGLLTLTSGLITTESNTITVGCDGNITFPAYPTSTSYINGKLARIYCTPAPVSKDFPIGKGGNYRPLTVNYTTLDATSTVTAEQFETSIPGTIPANTSYQTERYWTITQSGATSFIYSLTLNGYPFIPDPDNQVILKGNGTSNVAINATYSDPNFTIAGQTSFSNFAVGSSCAAPTINTQPSNSNASTCDGTGIASFTVSASGPGVGNPLSYQWQESTTGTGGTFHNITDDGGVLYLGSTSATLYINYPPLSMNGHAYRVVVSRNCGSSVTSNAVTLTVNALPTISLGANPSVTSGSTTALLPYTATTGNPDQYRIDYDATAEAANFVDMTYSTLDPSKITLTVPSGAAAGTYNGNLYVKNGTTGCVSAGADNAGYPFAITILSADPGTWQGDESASWNTPGNWSDNAVPNASVSVTIPSGTLYSPTVNVQKAVCGPMSISNNARLTIAAGADLTVYGTLTNNGTIDILSSGETTTGSLIYGSVTGNGTANVQRWMTKGIWHIISSPVSGMTVSTFLTDAANGINNYRYTDDSKNYDNWDMIQYLEGPDNWSNYFSLKAYPDNDYAIYPGTGAPLELMKGYSITRGGEFGGGQVTPTTTVENGPVTFSGALYSGDQSISVTRSYRGWNAIGNPFPSAIRINESAGADNFMVYNGDMLDQSYKALYLWDQQNNYQGDRYDYIVISNAGPFEWVGGDIGQKFISVGQGFIVRSKSGGGTITITPSMQSHQTTAAPFKAAQISWPGIRLWAKTNAGLESSTVVGYNDLMTRGLDPGYDVGMLKGNPEFAVYSRMAEGGSGVDFAIQCLPGSASLVRVPVGIDAKAAGQITFSADLSGSLKGQPVYLEDALLQKTTDLSVQNYQAAVTAGTAGTGRFFLYTGKLLTTAPVTPVNMFNVYSQGNRIIIDGEVKAHTLFTLYSIDGRCLLRQRAEDGIRNILDGSAFPAGVYILDAGNGQRTKVVLTPR